MTFNSQDPVSCPHCNSMCQITSFDNNGRWFFCSSCGITQYFFDFKCPVCKLVNTMYGKPLLNNCYECQNCKIIVIFTEIIDDPNDFKVKYKWYSGKFKDIVVDKQRKMERK